MMLKEDAMKQERFFLALDQIELGMVLHSLVDLRNKMLEEEMYDESVDRLIIKVGKAPTKKFKVLDQVTVRP